MENIILFSLSSSKKLAKKVADILNIPLGQSEIDNFSDGEFLVRTLDDVSDKIVYVIQSTSYPGAQTLMELLIFIDALKQANAKSINLVIPYYGFSRQDRVARKGEPITAKLIADLLHMEKVDRVISVDLHTPQIQGFFALPVDEISSIPLFGEYYRNRMQELGIDTKDVCVVSPDHGSINRARDLASELPNSQIAIIDKRRPAPNVAEVQNIVGDVKDKVCIIIDDIIDTAGTILSSTNALVEKGAKMVFVGGTHGIFSKNVELLLRHEAIKEIVVTDTIENNIPEIKQISIADIIAKVIKARIGEGKIPDSWLSFY